MFQEGLGTFKDFKARIYVDPEAKPRYCKARSVSYAKLDRYPVPKIEDLFATLSKGKSFTKVDLSQAYQQLPLEEESKEFVIINTTKGLFRYNPTSIWHLVRTWNMGD